MRMFTRSTVSLCTLTQQQRRCMVQWWGQTGNSGRSSSCHLLTTAGQAEKKEQSWLSMYAETCSNTMSYIIKCISWLAGQNYM